MQELLEFFIQHLPNLLLGFPGQRPGGLLLSIILAAITIPIGFVIGMVIGNGSRSRFWPVRWACRIYVEVFRGVPFILQVLLIYQVIGARRFGLDLSPLSAALISLALYSGAYQAEIVRAGLGSVPPQLVESAVVLGSNRWNTYQRIKLPFTLHVMSPAFVGQTISLFKDTSVLIIIGIAELMTTARIILGSEVSNASYWVGLYLFVGFWYFCIAFGFSQLARRWENKSRSGDLVHSLANY